MTLAELHFDIEKVNHSKASRAEAVDLVIHNLEVLPELIEKAYLLTHLVRLKRHIKSVGC